MTPKGDPRHGSKRGTGANAGLFKDLGKSVKSNDPPPKGLVKRAVAKVVRTQRKAVAQRPKKKGAK